jgi:hypothetical protein
MVGVNVQLLSVDGCPHWKETEVRLGEALDLLGDPSTIELLRVERPDDAARMQFPGSPSIRLNGSDPFASAG